jgi:hypothetical protein
MEFFKENFFFFFLLTFSFLSYIRYVYAQRNIYLLSLFFIPATFLHELTHFIVGLITFAKPTNFNLLPKKEGDSYVLGNVNFENINFFNALFTGIAPVLLIVALYFLDKNNFALYKEICHNYCHMDEFNLIAFFILVYINYIFIYSGIPSSQDFKVIFSHPFGIIFWGIIISIIFYIFFYKVVEFSNFFR